MPTILGKQDSVGPVLIGYRQPGLVYPARDRAQFARSKASDRGDLAAVTGRARAAIIRALCEAPTTSSLSETLGLAASTMSEHLHALHDAGLCTRRRAGRSVQYILTERGEALIRSNVPG